MSTADRLVGRAAEFAAAVGITDTLLMLQQLGAIPQGAAGPGDPPERPPESAAPTGSRVWGGWGGEPANGWPALRSAGVFDDDVGGS